MNQQVLSGAYKDLALSYSAQCSKPLEALQSYQISLTFITVFGPDRYVLFFLLPSQYSALLKLLSHPKLLIIITYSPYCAVQIQDILFSLVYLNFYAILFCLGKGNMEIKCMDYENRCICLYMYSNSSVIIYGILSTPNISEPQFLHV